MENQTPTQDPVVQTPVINPQPVVEPPVVQEPVIETPVPQPEPEITPEAASTSNEYQPVLDQYAANTDKLPPIETLPQSTEEQLQNLGITTPPKTGGGFLKALFIVALIIFIFVAAALALVYFKSQNKSSTINDMSSTISPTIDPSMVCSLNDKIYKVGESFASADGCNTCTCDSTDVITCTEKACATPTVATKSATTSSIPKDWKTYTDSTYKYSIQYPSTWIIDSKIIDNQILLISSPERIKDLEKNLTGTVVEGEITIRFNKDLYQKILNKNQTVEEYLKSLEDVSNIKKTKIGNIDAFSFDEAGMQKTPTYFIVKANDIFSITSSLNFSQTELQLLNTFKFN